MLKKVLVTFGRAKMGARVIADFNSSKDVGDWWVQKYASFFLKVQLKKTIKKYSSL